MSEPFFSAEGIAKSFPENGGRRVVLPGVSLALKRGEIVALLGPSGCGKSTLLNILAGFSRPDAGQVLLGGVPCLAPGSDRAVVFQEDALFPWLTAEENVALGLRALPKRERRVRAEAMLGLTGLPGRGKSLPRELSGGMRQRAALARALALRPQVLLLDEPFASLDAITREQMQDLLVELHQAVGMTMLLVTHDVDEAMRLADAVLVMGRDGQGIVERFAIDQPRPRDVADPAFTELRGRIKESLKG